MIGDSNVTRFPNGLGTVDPDDLLADMKAPDPTQYHTYFDDFDSLVVQDGSVTPVVQWTLTLNAGTIALAQVNHGAILMTLANTDEAITQMQRTAASYLPTAGKKTVLQSQNESGRCRSHRYSGRALGN